MPMRAGIVECEEGSIGVCDRDTPASDLEGRDGARLDVADFRKTLLSHFSPPFHATRGRTSVWVIIGTGRSAVESPTSYFRVLPFAVVVAAPMTSWVPLTGAYCGVYR